MFAKEPAFIVSDQKTISIKTSIPLVFRGRAYRELLLSYPCVVYGPKGGLRRSAIVGAFRGNLCPLFS